MYILAPSTYPYSYSQLRADNPGTSFPDPMPDERLAEWGVFPVGRFEKPTPAPGEVVEEAPPVEINGLWTQQWRVRPATQEETNSKAGQIRSRRNQLLAECDWTQLSDAPVDSLAWANYRQALRDISTQPGFPWSVNWPTQP